jgi:acyl-CoA thioesterase FadM
MRATLTLVWIDGMKAAAWPAQMRAQLEAHLEGGA